MSIVSIAKKKSIIQKAFSNQVTTDQTYSLCLYDGSNTVYCANAGSVRKFTLPLTQRLLSSTTLFAGTTNGVGATPVSNQTNYANNRFSNISSLALDGSNNLYVGDCNGPTQIFSTTAPSTQSSSVGAATSTIGVSSNGQNLIAVNNTGGGFTYYTASRAGGLGGTWTTTKTISSISSCNWTGISNLSWVAFVPGAMTGNFMGGPNITTQTNAMIANFMYTGMDFTPSNITINTYSTSLVSSTGYYSGQIYSATFDSSSNAYFLMMPIGSSNLSNIAIKYGAYDQGTGNFDTGNYPLITNYTIGAIRKSIPVPYFVTGNTSNLIFFLANPAAAVSNYYASY